MNKQSVHSKPKSLQSCVVTQEHEQSSNVPQACDELPATTNTSPTRSTALTFCLTLHISLHEVLQTGSFSSSPVPNKAFF